MQSTNGTHEFDVEKQIKSLPVPDERSAKYEIRAELSDITSLIDNLCQQSNAEAYERGVNDTIAKYLKGDYTTGTEKAIDEAEARARVEGIESFMEDLVVEIKATVPGQQISKATLARIIADLTEKHKVGLYRAAATNETKQ